MPPSEIYNISKNYFFIEQQQWLLLRFNSCFQKIPGPQPEREFPGTFRKGPLKILTSGTSRGPSGDS